ncbi:MAG: AAA family ATPase, partial [Muribaculaceae bacterium]|nr:AAA family ATPase [Muribaculaceae bacterium]
MEERLKRTPIAFQRYMRNRINWNSRLIGLTGPRGVGKSTMMLQYVLQQPSRGKMLYVTADHFWFATHSLVELADEFVKEGGRWLCIDEVHLYQGWSRELKQIYDGHPDLHVVFTGSSVLDINKGEADLSRRAVMYHMQGLSFREYLKLFHDMDAPLINLDDILRGDIN